MDSLVKALGDTSHESIEGTEYGWFFLMNIYNGFALNFRKLYFGTGYHLSGLKSESWQKHLFHHLEESKSLNLKFGQLCIMVVWENIFLLLRLLQIVYLPGILHCFYFSLVDKLQIIMTHFQISEFRYLNLPLFVGYSAETISQMLYNASLFFFSLLFWACPYFRSHNGLYVSLTFSIAFLLKTENKKNQFSFKTYKLRTHVW